MRLCKCPSSRWRDIRLSGRLPSQGYPQKHIPRLPFHSLPRQLAPGKCRLGENAPAPALWSRQPLPPRPPSFSSRRRTGSVYLCRGSEPPRTSFPPLLSGGLWRRCSASLSGSFHMICGASPKVRLHPSCAGSKSSLPRRQVLRAHNRRLPWDAKARRSDVSTPQAQMPLPLFPRENSLRNRGSE